MNAGANRTFFAYNTLSGDTVQNADGTVGAPEVVSQISAPAQIGESLILALLKFSLIDSKPVMATRRKSNRHRERLSEKTPQGDAIVRSARK